MFVEITLFFAAGVGNLAWDLTGRRVSARARRKSRRARRREHLPLPVAGRLSADPLDEVQELAPSPFVEHSRRIMEELDRVVDHFDLILLRAAAGESLVGDVVFIGSESARERGQTLMREWIEAVAGLPTDLSQRLRDLGMPELPIGDALERERLRSTWPNAGSSSDMLEATAADLEGVVVLLARFLRVLTAASRDPYR